MSRCTETDKPTVQILLSTYNGERFLEAQIESFLLQDCFDQCKILIRDDGSTDGTRAILKQYEQMPGFRIEYGENLGITESYAWLLRNSDADCTYFAFSDQDDVWLPEKLSVAMERLKNIPEGKPGMFASVSRIVDANLDAIGNSVFPSKGVSYYNAMIQNVLPGHTQVINRALLELGSARGYSDVHVLDWWYYLVASAVGVVEFHPQYTVLHRQHENNAVGMKENPLTRFVRRIRYIKEGRGNAFSKQLHAFYTRYYDIMPEEYIKETEAFFDSMSTLRSRLKYILGSRAYRQGAVENLAFKFLYLIGKYKL